MTRRLYLYDSYLREIETSVVEVRKLRGRRAYLVLEETIFHPLHGGQPSDRGEVVGEEESFEVKKAVLEGGELLHYGVFREGRSFEEGERVVARLDWNFRYRVMRLHTAGHVLDYAVAMAHGRLVETLSAFHGPPRAYLEYGLEEEPRIGEILEVANSVVRRDLPVEVEYVEESRLEEVAFNAPNLGRLPKADVYRVVSIPGVNAMPCTGTHVRRTSEVGEIEIKGLEGTERGWKIFYDVTP